MKRNLTTFILSISFVGVFAQNEMMHLPNGSADISSTTSGNGVTIGPGFTDPEGRLHIFDKTDEGTMLFLEADQNQVALQGGGFGLESPDYFIRAQRNPNGQSPKFEFSVSVSGKIQSGLFNSAANEQLALVNNMAIYRGNNQKLRLELSNNAPRFLWKSPGNNFQFVNDDNSTVALQLGEAGQVGVNTGTFFGDHDLFVEGSVYITDDGEEDHSLYIEGSSIAEEMFVKLKGDWPDYVFTEDYKLMPLGQLETFILENGHLPNLPKAEDVRENGLALGETHRLLTEKVEELTLYILELKKEIDTLREEIKD